MYAQSAEVYDLLYSQKDYATETRKLLIFFRGRFRPPGRRLLETGCGTGLYLEHLRKHFEVEGLDISPEMIAAARRRLSGVPLHVGDFGQFDLGREFDVVVCLFSSIGYARNLRGLRRAIARMAAHLAPGGILVVEPWFSLQGYHAGFLNSSHFKTENLHVARMVTARQRGRVSIMDMHHLVGTPKGTRYFVERHEMGLFTDEEHRQAFEAAGLETKHDAKGLAGRGLWLGRKPPMIRRRRA